MNFPRLYKRTSTGATQIWTIRVTGDSYVTRSGQIDGVITESLPTVCVPMNSNRSNATTAEEQALVEAKAKFAKKLKEKYKEEVEDIDVQTFISPTLASPLKNRKKPLVFPAAIQTKLNGVCCVIDKQFGSRSRKGEIFYNIKHINKELEQFFIDNPDIVLHGELFNETLKKNLNRLVKLVAVTRKEKDLTPELIADSEAIVEFWIYDGYVKGKESQPYHKRIAYLHEKIAGLKFVKPCETLIVNDEEEIQTYFKKCLADGQEGAIVKMLDMPYKHKRVTDIIKFKEADSEEFKVVGFVEGNGNWTGCAKKAVCLLPSGETTNSNIYGDMAWLKYVLEHQDEFVGKFYTMDFQCYSEYGVPQLPWINLEIERSYE